MSKVLLLILLICTTGMLCAVTRIVDIDGSGQYTTIQSAINASVNGDVVLVYPGRYLENVVIQTNGITLQSLEATTNNPAYIDSTIIDGNATYTCIKVFADIQNIQIQGFSITNAKKNGNGGGIVITTNAMAIIKNCKIFNNIAVGGGGAILVAQATVSLSGVQIYNNRCLNTGGGILLLNEGSLLTFDPDNRCSIYHNIAGAGQDIYVSDAMVDIEVYLNTFTVQNPSNYYAAYYNQPGYHNQMIFHIQDAYMQETHHDLYVSPTGHDWNDGLTPQTALKTIHNAIYRTAQDSLAPKTVHVLPGTYSITDNEQIFPLGMKSWVNVVGSGMDSTFILGEPHPQFPGVDYMIMESFFQEHYIFSDMNITYAAGTEGNLMYGFIERNITLKNIKIEDLILNHETDLIFFVYLLDSVIDGLVINNVSLAYGSLIDVASGFNGTLKNCRITNCISHATSVSVNVPYFLWMALSSNFTMENCLFDNLVMSDDDSHCIGIGGTSSVSQSININIINSQFTNLTGANGDVHFGAAHYPHINITNCTFANCNGNNYAFSANGILNIRNTIFKNNTPYEIRLYPVENGETSNITVDYSSLRNGAAGIYSTTPGNQIHYLGHNTTANPLFNGVINPDMPFYSLTENSPCKDTGTPDTTGLFLPVADLAGHYRVWGESIDMGCYEYGSPVGNEDYLPPEVGGTLYNYPNPFNPSTTISYSLKEDGKVSLEIFNIRGQLVKSLASGFVNKGMHSIVWDGKDIAGNSCASGVYLYKLKTGSTSITRKMMMLK